MTETSEGVKLRRQMAAYASDLKDLLDEAEAIVARELVGSIDYHRFKQRAEAHRLDLELLHKRTGGEFGAAWTSEVPRG